MPITKNEASTEVGLNEIAFGNDIVGTLTSDTLFVRDPATGYIGVGTASPNALMDIVAANATPFAFSIRNSTHTANTAFGYKIYQENSGYMTFYMDGAKYMSISPNGSVSYSKSSYTSPDTQLISQAFAAGNASYGFYCRGYLSNNGLSVDGDGNVGINQLTASAKLHIKGADATSANYALKLDNSASSPLLYARNDGNIGMGVSPTNNRVTIQDAGGVNSQLVITSGSGATSFLAYSAGNQQLYFDAVYYGGSVIAKHTTATAILSISDQLRFCGNSGLTVNNSFSFNSLMNLDVITGNLGIGLGLSSGTAKLHVVGSDSTSSNYALKLDNSSASPLLYVRNDGLISAPLLPTSNTGLSTGDMYVATAAQILANGDKVVGWKV